ncbi:hypothetical protein [Amycolatopsis sp. MEPSY49]|uniref:hypothetical protein n=1 Tax=Amycolatopsis sp. MEPSY49 TaxID=3151600 RepID=UPI003EF6840E
MLVAFQRTGDERRLPAAAEHLVGLLRSWGRGPDHLTGLALAGITVPSRRGPRVVDALVFTRSGVVVIAAHEPGVGVSPGPEERAGAGVAAAKGALAAHDGGRYVTGLVAVVPPISEADLGGRLAEPAADSVAIEPGLGGHEELVAGLPEPRSADDPRPESGSHERLPDMTAETGLAAVPHPREPESVPDVAVVLADPRGLRRIIGQHNRWRTVWSADDVLDACYALSLAHLAPPRSALLADGFPARIPARLPVLPAVVQVAPDPPPPPPTADEEPLPQIPVQRGQAVFPRQRPIRLVPWALLFVLTVLVTVGVIAAVFVAQVFHGS